MVHHHSRLVTSDHFWTKVSPGFGCLLTCYDHSVLLRAVLHFFSSILSSKLIPLFCYSAPDNYFIRTVVTFPGCVSVKNWFFCFWCFPESHLFKSDMCQICDPLLEICFVAMSHHSFMVLVYSTVYAYCVTVVLIIRGYSKNMDHLRVPEDLFEIETPKRLHYCYKSKNHVLIFQWFSVWSSGSQNSKSSVWFFVFDSFGV